MECFIKWYIHIPYKVSKQKDINYSNPHSEIASILRLSSTLQMNEESDQESDRYSEMILLKWDHTIFNLWWTDSKKVPNYPYLLVFTHPTSEDIWASFLFGKKFNYKFEFFNRLICHSVTVWFFFSSKWWQLVSFKEFVHFTWLV